VNFWRLLCFAAVLAAGVGYGIYQFSLSAFTTGKSEETVTALQLTDAFVSTYSNERIKFGATDAAVPATFRAHSIELFNKLRQDDDVLRLVLVGRLGREIRTAPTDAQMADIVEAFARDPSVKSLSGFVHVDSTTPSDAAAASRTAPTAADAWRGPYTHFSRSSIGVVQ
jgi:hypothetical protein